MVIGLTGNSGSGKSSVANILKGYGAYIINADEIAHKNLLSGGAAYIEVVNLFNSVYNSILDENCEIDRKKLGAIVFRDEDKRKLLMEITHKYIMEEMLRELEENVKNYPYVVLDAPLLIEAGLHTYSDVVWVVFADLETRMGRIRKRDGLSDSQIEARFNSQTKFEELEKYADIVINNSSDLSALELEIKNVLCNETQEC